MRNLILKLVLSFVLCFTILNNTVEASDEVDAYIAENDEMEVQTEEIAEPAENEVDEVEENLEPVHEYFYDIPQSHFAYEAIERLYQLGAANYRVENKFSPDAPISRAELIHMIIRAKGIEPIDNIVPVFNDVDINDQYAPYIDVAHRLGMIDGVSSNEFRPGDPVRRDSLVKILVTATGELNVMWQIDWRQRAELLAPYSDMKTVASDSWVNHYVAYALKNNIISGYPDNTMRVAQYTTRAEAAVLVDRLFLKDNQAVAQETLISDAAEIPIPYVKKFDMTATQYNSSEPGLSSRTSSGLTTRVGVVAVDRSVIPLGTHLYIEGYGYAVAADIGGAIKGNKIDLYASNLQEARKFGIQPVCVYVLP